MTDPRSPLSSPDGLSLTDARRRRSLESTSGTAIASETMAAYIEGRLSAEERRVVEATIAADAEAYAWLVDAVAVARELPESQEIEVLARGETERLVAAVPRRRRWPLAIAGLATAATLALLLRGVSAPPPAAPDQTLASLVTSLGAPDLAPWMTGGFDVDAPLTTRGGPAVRPSTDLLRMAADLERAVAARPTAAAEHALGVALLVLGGDGRNEAVVHLERAAAMDPQPAFLSDLAAAYVDRAIRTGAAADADRGLDLVRRVLTVAPGAREALYNRALALQTLDRRPEALAAWTEFLATPEGPGHRAAREHLARLRARDDASAAPPGR